MNFIFKKFSGKDLIEMGYEPSKWFGEAISHLNSNLMTQEEIDSYLKEISYEPPKIPLQGSGIVDVHFNIDATEEHEIVNYRAVEETINELVKTPTIIEAAVMPDACPAGSIGTIPVGGVVAAEGAIHPGMHSADICCSLMASKVSGMDPVDVLDKIFKGTHFGPGGRDKKSLIEMPHGLLEKFLANPLLNDAKLIKAAKEHFGTQGDGNHFAYVGTHGNDVYIVTHHGSRAPGAQLFKKGMKIAEQWRNKLSPETLKQNAWIPFDTQDGQDYWNALQVIREWTKANHQAIHSLVYGSELFTWNEHNFVFQDNNIFYHAKGATPVDKKYMPDSMGTQIIPMNMSEPILIVQGTTTKNNLGFAPHGAGRNYSRTKHKKMNEHLSDEEIFREETKNIDARFFSGVIDISELPSAYKNATEVKNQILTYNLCNVIFEIEPFGCIMAGDWEANAPWRKK